MASHGEEQRRAAESAERPALEEAPTVLTRNPFHLDEKLTAPPNPAAEDDSARASFSPTPHDEPTHVSNRPVSDSESSVSNASPLKMGRTLEGQRLGHFELEKFVGGGGMGAVFRALDTMLGRIVAVKVLSRERTDADTLRRFKNEAQSAARLDHKNIARVHYVGEDNGWNYIVFEFIDGVNVRDVVEQGGPLNVDDALHYTMQVAEALDHAAQREVVHRDIKPSNIIITSKGRAKLVDMGLARLNQVESSNDDITASGVTLGTFDYISPEQARDPRAADVRSDIYSLGCTLYFMLCGRPPFPEGTVLQKLLSHNSDRPPDLQIFRPDVPDDIVDVVNRMLAKQPSQRYQTPAELMSELLLLAQKYQLSKVSAPAELWTETKPARPAAWERHLPWMAPLIILLFSVLLMDLAFPAAQPDLSDLTPAVQSMEPVPAEATGTPATVPPTTRPANTASQAQPSSDPESTDVDRPPEEKTPGTATATEQSSTEESPEAASAVDATAGSEPTELQPTEPGVTVPQPPSDEPIQSPAATELDSSEATRGSPAAVPSNVISIARNGEPDSEVFARFQDALRQAAAAEEIEIVQLAFDGPLIVPATIRIQADEIQIVAAEGSFPELRFEPEPGRSAMSAMLAFRGSYLSLSGIRLSLFAPNEITRAGWAMIHAGALAKRIEIRDSVMSFSNPMATEIDEHGATFIRLEPLAVSQFADNDMAPPVVADSTDISLQRCLLRGAATCLRAQPGKAVSVDWDQGLLATSERMLDIENAVGSPPGSSMVRLALTRVTAVAEKGLCRMGANSEPASHPLPLDVELNSCVVRTSPEAPLVETEGVDSVSDDPDMLFILEQSGTKFSRTRLRQKFAGLTRKEQLMTDSISWQNPVPVEEPWHEHTYENYLIVATANEDATAGPAGFDPALLPQLMPFDARAR